ncbi:MAG: helix-turn-helix transcriptional regulator [Muribaculaceae bacterium]|nr:helix-turn-helix transcriptional regulator [Muribaculaceae bacterium]
MLSYVLTVVLISCLSVLFSCKKAEKVRSEDADESLRQVLYVQWLYNTHPAEDIVPEITAVIDSMRGEGRNSYYFAALNILIDRLFSDGRYAEADSLAVRMEEEALADSDSISMAMACRVRAQMYYKLSQPSRALKELEPALRYITNPYLSCSGFGTATSNQEWMWIIARELEDTMKMNQAGMEYARLVDENSVINNWTDPTGHYPVSALAFKAEDAFLRGDLRLANELLDSASGKVRPDLPSRAYEHLYTVRCRVRAAYGDWAGATADADTLLRTHRDFPWFYLKDLLLKAEILNMAGKHEESARAYSQYIAFHDSLTNLITDKRLHDLSVLYRTEIDQEQKRADRFRLFAFGSAIFLLVVLLAIAVAHAFREKRRIRILVERLKELDRASENGSHIAPGGGNAEMLPIDRIDHYMLVEQPYTNPALSRKELAEYVGISQDAFGRLVKTEKGMTVHAYINSFRLEEARKTLGSDSAETIAEMAVRLGFGTSRTFQRAFKERYNMSPTQYREAAREIEASENQ